MINKDLTTLLKEGKGDQIKLEIDPDHPEDYSFTKVLWDMIKQGVDWLPKLKSK